MHYFTSYRFFFAVRRPLRASGITPNRYYSKKCDPLRILFCGSDEFSVASLNAIHTEHIKDPQTIASIDVVCRPGKRVGRGLKTIREVPIKSAATKLGLPIHEIDTFTGWTPPTPQGAPINLIIAVSFGLFVPSRILKGAKYGGLNVHPSLLPDFRGPAPLHHTLMAGETKTGITLQTLDTKEFDHGLILDQTPAPGFDIPDPETCDVPRLLSLVSEKGAQMLLDGIRNRVFVPPLKPISSSSTEGGRALRRATKIRTEDRHPDWSTWTWDRIRRYQRVIGPLWNTALIRGDSPLPGQATLRKRIIFTKMEGINPSVLGISPFIVEPGLPFADARHHTIGNEEALYVFTVDGSLVRIDELKVEGEKAAPAYKAALKAKLIQPLETGSSICRFYGPLQ
ncbi:hypothetical protein VTO42DRAFT_8741 [Malbranchea cinnamomea]